jgi:Tol biopolymer transport system component
VRKACVAAAIVLLASCEAPATPTGPLASPLASTTARPGGTVGATLAASPTPEPTSRPGIRATPAGAVPESFRYVALDRAIADGYRTRLWLVDLDSKRAPVQVAEWDAPAAPVGGHSISADGRTVVVSAAGSRSRVALYLLRPETGETRVLFEEPGAIAISARVAPDGARFAFTKYPADGGSDLGIWWGATAGGELRQLAERTTTSNVPAMPLAWSADSALLAFTRELEDRTEVHLSARDGGSEIVVGPGDRASWRREAPQLLVAEISGRTARAYTFDLTTRKTVDVVTVERLAISVVEWHPSLPRFLYVESEGASREASGGVWVRSADGSGAMRVDSGRVVFAPQWSRDGTVLSALSGGDDAIAPVLDLLSGRRIAILCRRGGTPPADCS